MARRAVLAVIVLLLLAFPAGRAVAGKPEPLAERSRAVQLQRPVENQTDGQYLVYDPALWVVNPTPCAWDTDDRIEIRALGDLDPGRSWSTTACVIADNFVHALTGNVGANRDGVTVDVAIAPTGKATNAGPDRLDPNTYQSSVCLATNWYAWDDPILQPIPGSDGGDGGRVGIGTELTITWTITNTGRQRAAVDAMLDVAWFDPLAYGPLCPNGIVGAP